MSALLKYMLSGGAANANSDLSLGGAGSATQMATLAMNNLFDNSTPPESAAGFIDYRAIDVFNNGNATAQLVELFMGTETASPNSQIDFSVEGIDPAVPIQLADEADSTNLLVGFTWTHNLAASKLALPDIPAASRCRVWLRRTLTAGAVNHNNDLGTLSVWVA